MFFCGNSDDGEAAAVRFVETHEEAPDRWVHRFVFDGRVGATYRVSASTPKGDLLFFPAVASVDVAADAVADIVAQPGLYLTGHIRPAIADVQVKKIRKQNKIVWNLNGLDVWSVGSRTSFYLDFTRFKCEKNEGSVKRRDWFVVSGVVFRYL